MQCTFVGVGVAHVVKSALLFKKNFHHYQLKKSAADVLFVTLKIPNAKVFLTFKNDKNSKKNNK